MIVFAAELKVLPLAIFGLVLAVTLGITYWASKRTSTATEFWAAGRGVSGLQKASPSPATTCRRPRSSASPA